MGRAFRGFAWSWFAAERVDCRCFPFHYCPGIPGGNTPTVLASSVEQTTCFLWSVDRRPHLRPLVRPGNAAQSTIFRFHDAQRPRTVSRLLLVLLHQRAHSSIFESAIPARLQHRASPVVLVAAFGLALSMEL